MSLTDEIISQLKAYGSEANRKGMQRYGIVVDKAFGVPLPAIRELAKEYRMNHNLALQLWKTGIHEARMLATMIDDPEKVTEAQMEQWVKDFNSWDICDQCCSNLFDKTPFAIQKIYEWCKRDEEFVKRASFVLIACLAVHDKKLTDDVFVKFFALIEKYSTDNSNFVYKSVNWALRQIGKRNQALYNKALRISEKLIRSEDKTARWIGSDARRELKGETAIKRMKRNQLNIEFRRVIKHKTKK